MSLVEPLISAKPSIIRRVPPWIKSTLKLVAPVLFVSLNLFLIYFPSIFKEGRGLGELLRSPDAYGFLIALIFNSAIAVVAYSYSRIEDGLFELRDRIGMDGITDHVNNLGKIINRHRIKNAVLDLYFQVEESEYSNLFGSLAEDRLERLRRDLSSMVGENPHCTLIHREPAQEYIDLFVRIMQRLIDEGSTFDVLTNSTIWSRENFGKDQRYLIANTTAVKSRNIHIRRVCLVPAIEVLKELDNEVLGGLCLMLVQQGDVVERVPGLDLVVYCCSTMAEYEHRFENNFAVWSVSGRPVCTVIEYSEASPERRRIIGITFTPDKETVSEKRAAFDYHFDRATKLTEYLPKLKALVEERKIDLAGM